MDIFDKALNNFDKTFKIMLGIWAIGIIISLSLLGLGLYVAWHFISTFW